MTYTIGQLVTLTTEVRTTAGVLTNATMSLAVTKPDGTAATPSAISNPSTGMYTATVTADQAGIWLYVWTATGAVQSVEDDQFGVSAIGVRLMSLAEARDHLNLGSVTTYDTELRDHIDAATRAVEARVGACVPRTTVEVISAGSGRYELVLSTIPVISLTTVAAVLTGGTSYLVADLDFDPDTGVVWREDGGGFAGRLRVTYRAGRTVIPANHLLAGKMIVQHLWESQRGGGTRRDQLDDLVPTGLGFSVPRRAVELLDPDWVGPGIG